jgi:dihydroorotase
MARLVIRNGRIIDPSQDIDTVADLAIEDAVIRQIDTGIDTTAAEVLDASGMIVAPGFIDMHVHLREPGFEDAETIETGTNAAIAGGFTSVACMPNTRPVNDNAEVTRYIVEKAREVASANVYPIAAITMNSAGEELTDIGALKQAGAIAISDDGKPVMNAQLTRRAMELCHEWDIPMIQHCEDLHLSNGGAMHEGAVSCTRGLSGIPRSSEDVMVARDIILAETTGAKYHVAHVSSKYSVGMVAFAKSRGLRVSAEATPHHFVLTDEDIPEDDCNYKMKPPLRDADDREAVALGLCNGTIDAIATDHAPHPESEKKQRFERCPFGIIGLETALGLALEYLYHPGRLNLMRLVQLFTTGPASILALPRGTLRVGAAADVTVFGLDRDRTYDVNASASKSRNSPFHGHRFRGGPVATIVAGKVVYRQK